jgi:hypothetical protein
VPGLIVCSWSRDEAERAAPLFARAREAFRRFQGLECTAEETGPAYRIARFAGAKSPYPKLIESAGKGLVAAVAGWCFIPGRGLGDWPSIVAELAASPRGDRDSILDRFQGQYALALADTGEGSVQVSGDHLGAYPLYTAELNGIAWASTSAMTLAYALRAPLDLAALRALFMDDAIRSPQSAFEGIRRSRFGERHLLKGGRVVTRRVWSPFPEPVSYRRLDDAVERGIALLRESGLQMEKAWPRWVTDLTSGLDSRLLASVMANHHEPVHATVNGSPRDLDVITARRIADELGWPLLHNELPADWGRARWEFFQKGVALADGEKPGHAIDGSIWAKTILRGSYDAATGGGGGELLRDFLWQQDYPRIGRTADLNTRRLVRLMFTFGSKPDIRLFRRDWRREYEDAVVGSIEEIAALAPEALNNAKLDAVYLWRVSGHYGRYGGAAFPVIASPQPLMTESIASYSFALPWRFRLKGKLVRHLITRLHPKLASMPTWHGGAAEPLTIRRPIRYAEYHVNLAAKAFRKVGRMAFKSTRFAPPTTLHTLPSYNTDFVGVLDREGFLEPDRLVTRKLYEPVYLRDFLRRAKTAKFGEFGQLYSIVSIELVCRLCEIDPGDRSF